jgi:hypothetical protein
MLVALMLGAKDGYIVGKRRTAALPNNKIQF